MKNKKENSFYVSSKLPFKLDQFFSIVPKESIVSVSSTHIRVNIVVNDVSKIEVDKLKELKNVKGVVVMSNKISLVLNEFAPTLEQALKENIGGNKNV